jgi:hypothetical protein
MAIDQTAPEGLAARGDFGRCLDLGLEDIQ